MADSLSSLLAQYHKAKPDSPTVAPKKDTGRYRAFRRRYSSDPVAMIYDCVDKPGRWLAPYQEEIIGNFPSTQRSAVRGPHGLGKTAMAALLVLWWALTSDVDEQWKAPTLSSSWRQVQQYLWPEIHTWARLLKWNIIGREPLSEFSELLQLQLKLQTGQSWGMASDVAELIEGCHATRLLFMFDESKAIKDEIFDAAEGAFSTPGYIRVGAWSTPGAPIGRFYDIHARKPGFEDWAVRHVTLDEAIRAGRITREWAEARKRQFGVDSAKYQNRVLGEFAVGDEDGLIPSSWVQRAVERWEELAEAGEFDGLEPQVEGVDVSRKGKDATCRAKRRGDWIFALERSDHESTMTTADRVNEDIKAGGQAVIDVNNIGAGVYDRLEQLGANVVAYCGTNRTHERDLTGQFKFFNVRSMAYWRVKEWLDPDNGRDAALPPDELLLKDLAALGWDELAEKTIQVTPKKLVMKKLGRSSDAGDSVAMAICDMDETAEVSFY